MQGEVSLDEWIRHHSTGLGWVASDGFDLHGPFDDPIDTLRYALARSDYGDFVTLAPVIESIDPVSIARLTANGLLDALYGDLADSGYAPIGGLEDVPEAALDALERALVEALRRALAAWRSACPAHLPDSVWRASGNERIVTTIDLNALLSLRRKSA